MINNRVGTAEREFAIETTEPGLVTVRHLGEGHRYTFRPTRLERGGRVLSCRTTIRANTSAEHSGYYYVSYARCFAETEARRRGMID
jgi:hypothetical protein